MALVALVTLVAETGRAGAGSDEPLRASVREWSASWAPFADDFDDGAFGRTLPYSSDCVETAEAEGELRVTVDPGSAGCDGVVGAARRLPAPERVGARFAFEPLGLCEGRPAVGFAGVPDGSLGEGVAPSSVPDGAFVVLARGPLPGVGEDVLAALLLAEDEGGPGSQSARPIERLVLSERPESDPELAGVETIELELRVQGAGDALRPHGLVRLCDTAECSGEPAGAASAAAALAALAGLARRSARGRGRRARR